MAYQSEHTGTTIDTNVAAVPGIENKISNIQNKLDTIEEGANKLVDNCIQTSYLQNESVTTEKLAPEVADSLASVKLYCGILSGSNWSDDLADSEDYASMKNKWKFEKFSSRTCNSTIRDTLLSVIPNSTSYVIDGSITTSNYNTEHFGESYTARCTIYAYCANNVDYTTTFVTDDAGALYLNGSLISTNASCTPVTVTLPFLKGINCIEAFYTEGSSGDGWAFGPALSTRIGYEFEALYAVPAHTYTQTITPICLDGNLSINSNFVFSPGMCLTSNIAVAADRDRINTGIVIGNEDGTITVKYSNQIPVTNNITMYWFGKDTT